MEWTPNDYSGWMPVFLLFIAITFMIRTVIIILYLLLTFVVLILPWSFLNHLSSAALYFPYSHTHTKISAYMLTAHLHAHPHSSSMPSGHLQGGHNPSEWWECWAGTYQRCQYDQQHLYPPHIHTRAHTLPHGYLSVCMWVATGVYKCAETALACVFCMHAVVINFCWRGEKPVFSASLCAALWCIVFVCLRDCSSMLRLCKICMSHMCSALWTCRRVFGRCFCSVCSVCMQI